MLDKADVRLAAGASRKRLTPAEIEEFLLSHPKIREAQVLGLPDERLGEQVSAWIIPTEAGALSEDARTKQLADPDYIWTDADTKWWSELGNK